METKLNALMLRAVDYKDNDKMLTLYSVEKGLVSAGIKGVKKAGAKLNFACQPFCFAEYLLNVNGERATVIGATELESFYNLRLNLTAFYCATAICEYLLKCASAEQNEPLFMLAVNAIKKLNFAEGVPEYLLADFLIKALEIEGYGINAKGCANCGELAHLGEFSYFDFEKGCLFCEDCANEGATRIMCGTAEGLQAVITGEPTEKENLFYLLKFLNYYLNVKVGAQLKAIDELLQLP